MKARIGDAILIESEKAGTPPRTGRIEEVLQESWGIRYRVRWDDGHESTIHPIAGAARIKRRGRAEDEWQFLG
jgi:hypothetical protein